MTIIKLNWSFCRKPVSSCLSSDFRETMDRLMEVHKGTETSLLMRRNSSNNNNGDEHFDDEEANNERGTRTKQLVALLQQRMRCSVSDSVKEDDNEIKQEEQEEEEKEIVMISGSSSNNNNSNEEIIISDYNNNNENTARAPTFSSFVISREISEDGGNNNFDRATNCRSIPQLPFHQPQCSSPTTPHSIVSFTSNFVFFR